MFYSYHNLQGSQTNGKLRLLTTGFTLIIIYKVLKHVFVSIFIVICFTLIIIYKVLKPEKVEFIEPDKFYSYHNLQGSQTILGLKKIFQSFYSYHNLQGSQTLFIFNTSLLLVLLLS